MVGNWTADGLLLNAGVSLRAQHDDCDCGDQLGALESRVQSMYTEEQCQDIRGETATAKRPPPCAQQELDCSTCPALPALMYTQQELDVAVAQAEASASDTERIVNCEQMARGAAALKAERDRALEANKEEHPDGSALETAWQLVHTIGAFAIGTAAGPSLVHFSMQTCEPTAPPPER